MILPDYPKLAGRTPPICARPGHRNGRDGQQLIAMKRRDYLVNDADLRAISEWLASALSASQCLPGVERTETERGGPMRARTSVKAIVAVAASICGLAIAAPTGRSRQGRGIVEGYQ
jgi:hypothetical protein